jgi:hypothetical protein
VKERKKERKNNSFVFKGGCHCLESWTGDNGKIYSFPNNCGDPAGKRG